MVIEHNIPAMNANRFLGINNAAVASSLEKLSSGLRINKAADDAAGLAISEKMRNQINGLEMAEQNAKNGISLIQTAEGALNESHAILSRMRELAVQSSNGTYDAGDRQMITEEFDQLKEELNRIAESTNYNGIKLLDGSLSSKGVSASTGAGSNTGTFIPETKASFVIDASDAFGEAQKAQYTYDLSGLFSPSQEGTDVLDNLSLGGLDGSAGEAAFTVGGYTFKYKADGAGGLSGTDVTFKDLATLKTGLGAITTASTAWDMELSDDGILTLTAGKAGALEPSNSDAEIPDEAQVTDLVFADTLVDAGVTPKTIEAVEVVAGRSEGPQADPNPIDAVSPGIAAQGIIDDTNSSAHNVKGIEWSFSGLDDTFNGKQMSGFKLNTGATGSFEFELNGKTFKTGTVNTTTNNDLSTGATYTFSVTGEPELKAVLTITDGSEGTAAAALMTGFATDVAAGTQVTLDETGKAGYTRPTGEYTVGGKTFKHSTTTTTDATVDDGLFNTVDGLVKELENAFGSEYTFAANDDGTVTATAINAGSAKSGGATINLDDRDGSSAVVDSSVVTGSMGNDGFKANKSGANTISSALSDVLEFGNTGVVKGTGTEYRVSADKKAEFIATLDTADTSEAGILKALDLSTQDYTLTNEDGGDLVITAKASGADPNEEKILLHSQQNYRSLLYKEKDGTDDYRNLTISVDANKVGDTKFIGNTVTIDGNTYQFTGQSDKNESGVYAKAGDKLDNGNYAIDIGALADEDDATYAAGISKAIVDAVNVVEADAFDVEGIEFAVTGKGMGDANVANPNVATFSIRVNSAGITSNNNAGGLVFQIGANGSEDQRISMSINAMDAKSLGETSIDVEFAAVTGMTVQDASVGTVEDANKAIDILDGATQMVSAQRANLGALQNRLESTLNSLGVSIENLSSAESIIRDTDMAKEMMEFSKNNIKVQAAQAMLAQANQLPQAVLQLLR